jgi:hypothetical protein
MSFYGYHLINRSDPGAGSKKDPHVVSNKEVHEVMPNVVWAQRSNCLYITVQLPGDSKPDFPKFKIDEIHNSLRIVCEYEDCNLLAPTDLTLQLFESINLEKSEWKRSQRTIVFNITKKQPSSEYWPRLLKIKEKRQWLNVDHHKIVDEDEEHTHNYKWSGGEKIINADI